MTFGNSSWLWALILLAPLAWLFYHAHQRREVLLSKLIASRLHASLAGRVSLFKRTLRTCLLLLTMGLLVIALARPRFGYEERQVPTHGRDVMIAIDTSRSMLSTDVAPSRLARAQLLGQDVLDLLPGDRVGLIAFAGKAFLQAPMTLDHAAVRDALTELDTNLIPKGGTNISEAIHLAITAFGKGEGSDRALILMTDGEDLEEDAVTAAKEAGTLGIKIFTIGIGSPEGSLIPITNEQNQHDFVRDEQGKPVLSKLDVSRLKEIAAAGNGFYEPFGSDAARTIVQRGILPLAAGDTKSLTAKRPIERYEWPLGGALVLLAAWLLLNERRRKVASISIFLLGSLFFLQASNAATGLSDYNQGNYPAALKDFEQRLKAGNAAPEVRFDAGAAAYQQGDYKKAVDYFTGAMTAPSSKLQQMATYNLANALVRQGEAATEGKEKLSDWNNAIQHYDTVLKADPKNQNAKDNREIVKKLIEDFKKQQEQQKKDQKQDKNQQQNNPSKDQQQKDQQQKDQKEDQQQQSSNKDSSQDKSDGKPQDSQKQGGPTPTPTPAPSPSPSEEKGKESAPTPTPSPTPSHGSGSDGAATPTPTPNGQQQPASGQKDQQQNQPQPSPNQSDTPSSKPSPQPTPGAPKKGELSGGEQGKQAAAAANASAAEEGTNGMMSANQAEAILRSMQEEEQKVQFQQRKQSEETAKDW